MSTVLIYKQGRLLDYEACMAIGQDAGNRNMRKHGREIWNLADQIAAADTTNELLQLIGYPGVNND